MNPVGILAAVAADGLEVTHHDDRLRVRGPDEVLARWLPVIREHKAELLRLLEARGDPLPQPPPLVRCASCSAFERLDLHPHLGHCSKGEPEAICGLWDTDFRVCAAFLLPAPDRLQ